MSKYLLTSFTYPALSNRRFSGLRSRYTISLECKYWNASTTQAVQNRVVESSKLPLYYLKINVMMWVWFRGRGLPVPQNCPQFPSKTYF